MSRRASEKIRESEEELEELSFDMEDLKKEMDEKTQAIKDKYELLGHDVTKHEVKPRRTDVLCDEIILVWAPYWVNAADQIPAYI